jgi:hypothetical protein
MCNHCSEHSHSHGPEIVQLMPVQKELYAVFQVIEPYDFALSLEKGGLCIVPVLFMALIRDGETTMIEGFFASNTIASCETLEGFKGYASSPEDAERLYSNK